MMTALFIQLVLNRFTDSYYSSSYYTYKEEAEDSLSNQYVI